MDAEEITQVDQVAEVLARVAGEHGEVRKTAEPRNNADYNLGRTRYEMRCTCGAAMPWADDGPAHLAHVAAAQAAALWAAGLVVEGTEVEEWGVRFGDGEIDWWAESLFGSDRDAKVAAWSREDAEAQIAGYRKDLAEGRSSDDYEPMNVVHRFRTTYPERVTEWVAVDEGGE